MDQFVSIGRRKAAVARVFLKKGKGRIRINNRDLKIYFPTAHLQGRVLEPLKVLDAEKQFDVNVNVNGGGMKGQAEAILLGIARNLCKVDEENKSALKKEKLLTRDARVVERKKFGRKKARKSPQFSKR